MIIATITITVTITTMAAIIITITSTMRARSGERRAELIRETGRATPRATMTEAVDAVTVLPCRTPSRPWRRFDSKWILIGVPVVLVMWLALVPLVFLLWQSFLTPQTAAQPAVFTLDNFRTAYFSAETFRLFFNSVQYAAGTAVFALCLGTTLAWMNERTNTPFKKLFFALSIIPLVIPGILFTVAWIMLASPKIGILNVCAAEAVRHRHGVLQHLHHGRDDLGRRPALFADGVPADDGGVPLHGPLARGIGADERRLDAADRAAGSRSSSPGRRRAGSLLILFVRSLESFEVPALLGLPVGIQVYTSSIYQAIHQYPSQIGLAAAYAITLLLITSVGIYLQSRLAYQGSRYSTVTGKGFRPRTIDLGRWRYFTAGLFILYFVVIVLLPFLVLVWSSLQKFYSAPSWAALSRLSLDSYRTILDYPQFWSTVRNSLFLAFTDRRHHHAARRGDLLGGGAHQDPGPLGARQPRLAAAGVPGPRARAVDHDLLPLPRHRRLRHDLDHADRLCDALPALRHALRVDLDAADPQGARGIRRHERRLLGPDLPPRRPAAAEAGAAGRLDLRA